MLRILLRFRLALIIAVACLNSCDRSESSGATRPITLRFWNGFTGPDGRTMLAIVKRFNAENPDVHVLMQRMEWGTYYNKLFVAALGGRAPEVFVIHTEHINRFRHAGFLRPSDDIAGKGDGLIGSDGFDANVWQACERDGKHWTIPLDIHLEGMFFNRRLFKEA